MNNILKYIKSYCQKNPINNIQSVVLKIENHLLSKHFNKANLALYKLASESFLNNTQAELSKEICLYLEKEEPKNIQSLILLSSILLKERSFTLAKIKLDKLLYLDKSNKEVLQLHIDFNERLNNKTQTILYLEQYLSFFPENREKRTQLSQLLIKFQPLQAFQALIKDPNHKYDEIYYHLAQLLYQIEMYDLAIIFYKEYQINNAFYQPNKSLKARVKIEKPEQIYRFFIDQSEIRSYSEVKELNPNQYHFEFESIHNSKFEKMVNLEAGWDYLFSFQPHLVVSQTHFIQKPKHKLKHDILLQHRSIKELLSKHYPQIK
ncbi:MAG: hypothetical protein COB02_11200 [Candidatus Cloacimonadota bacterium]|nr:MAG: hypothetical protein COB02_11200 [Candidatus Cloacimonadota bacterium]